MSQLNPRCAHQFKMRTRGVLFYWRVCRAAAGEATFYYPVPNTRLTYRSESRIGTTIITGGRVLPAAKSLGRLGFHNGVCVSARKIEDRPWSAIVLRTLKVQCGHLFTFGPAVFFAGAAANLLIHRRADGQQGFRETHAVGDRSGVACTLSRQVV